MSNILQSVRNATLAGLALATVVSHTGAKSLPSARLTERTTFGPRSEAARISAGEQEAQTQRAPEPTIGKPVQVTYEDGQLSIIAENSTLSDVMKALREALGTEFDLPTNAAGERIWVRLGPGPARRVLRDLLDSTEFNYVIQAADDESGIRSISLTPRTKADNPAGVPDKAGASRRAVHGMSGSTAPDAADPESSATQEPSTAADPAATTPAPAPSTTDQSASTNMQGAGNTDLNTSKAASPSPTRPEQMMQQLQSMYQQRRQIQAQQNQKASAPN